MKSKTKVGALAVAAIALLALLIAACGGGGGRVGTMVTRYELQKGDCIRGLQSGDETEVLECSSENANWSVLKTAEMDESEFQGEDWVISAGSEVCSDVSNSDFLRPTAASWSIGDRLVVCLLDLREDTTTTGGDQATATPVPENDSSGSGFDSTALSGRWNTSGGGYTVLSFSREFEGNEGRGSVYTFTDYGLFGEIGNGEVVVFSDGSAELEGTNALSVFVCFSEAVSGRFTFTQNEFSGQIWCTGDPSDASNMSGVRAR